MAVIPSAPPPTAVTPPATGAEQNAQRRSVEIQSERPTEESFQSRNENNQDVVVIENPERQASRTGEEAERAVSSPPDGQGTRVDIRI